MKSLYFVLCFLCSVITVKVFAQLRPIPEVTKSFYTTSTEVFKRYQSKTPAEIYDGHYDETDLNVLFQVSTVKSLFQLGSITELEYQDYKWSLLALAAEIFTAEQLQSIVSVANERFMQSVSSNMKNYSSFFSLVLKYKNKSIKEKKLNKLLAKI